MLQKSAKSRINKSVMNLLERAEDQRTSSSSRGYKARLVCYVNSTGVLLTFELCDERTPETVEQRIRNYPVSQTRTARVCKLELHDRIALVSLS